MKKVSLRKLAIAALLSAVIACAYSRSKSDASSIETAANAEEVAQVKVDDTGTEMSGKRMNSVMKKALTNIGRFVLAGLLAIVAYMLASSKSDALIKAAKDNDTEKVTRLIKAGADVNARNKLGYDALSYTTWHDAADIAKALIAAGADVNARRNKDKHTALMLAAEMRAPNVANVLIEAGADVNAQESSWKWTALMYAAGNWASDVAESLIKAGADVNAENDDGETALMVAAENNDDGIVKILIEAGADMNARNNNGKTALMIAEWYNSEYALEALKAAGAKE